MLIKLAILGLVLTSLVLTLPTPPMRDNKTDTDANKLTRSLSDAHTKQEVLRDQSKMVDENKAVSENHSKEEVRRDQTKMVDENQALNENDNKEEVRRESNAKMVAELREKRRPISAVKEEKDKRRESNNARLNDNESRREVNQQAKDEQQELTENKKPEQRRVMNKDEARENERRSESVSMDMAMDSDMSMSSEDKEKKEKERRAMDKDEAKENERRETKIAADESKERRAMDKDQEKEKEESRRDQSEMNDDTISKEKRAADGDEDGGEDTDQNEGDRKKRATMNDDTISKEKRATDGDEDGVEDTDQNGGDRKKRATMNDDTISKEKRATDGDEDGVEDTDQNGGDRKKRATMNDDTISKEKRAADGDEDGGEDTDQNGGDRKKRATMTKENNSTDLAASMCDSVTDFKYYQKHPSDPSKYVQCDPWGSGHVKQCVEDKLWNEWTLKCDVKENIRNMTLDLSKFSVTTAGQPRVNCSLVGMECLNGGSCVQSATLGEYKCACRTDYTGQFCESRVDLSDVTHEILNGTFSVVNYRKRLLDENVTMSVSYYEKYKSQLDNLTYTELMNYLTMYKDGEVRYDTLANSIVEDILENIYPDAEYLSVFNASEQNVVAMVQMIPSLLSYSRYSFERYEDVFAQYQNVLIALVPLLNTSLPTIGQEATQYTKLTGIFLNQTLSLMKGLEDQSLVSEDTSITKPIQLTEADIKHSLEVNYNETIKATEKLLAILETYQTSVVKELETNASAIVTTTLGQAKFKGASEMLAVLNEVSVASAQIWDSLVNYGFWYLTNVFSTAAKKVDSIQKFSLNLNKF